MKSIEQQGIENQPAIAATLGMAISQKPKFLIMAYITDSGQVAVVKQTGIMDAEALLFVSLQAAVLEQARQSLFGSKGKMDSTPSPNPERAN